MGVTWKVLLLKENVYFCDRIMTFFDYYSNAKKMFFDQKKVKNSLHLLFCDCKIHFSEFPFKLLIIIICIIDSLKSHIWIKTTRPKHSAHRYMQTHHELLATNFFQMNTWNFSIEFLLMKKVSHTLNSLCVCSFYMSAIIRV